MKSESNRFWLLDAFIDSEAKSLTVYAQVVFVALSRHANRKGETWVGVRKLAEELGISKNTVVKAIKELSVSHLVVRCPAGMRGLSHPRVGSVPFHEVQRPTARDTRNGLRNSI